MIKTVYTPAHTQVICFNIYNSSFSNYWGFDISACQSAICLPGPNGEASGIAEVQDTRGETCTCEHQIIWIHFTR